MYGQCELTHLRVFQLSTRCSRTFEPRVHAVKCGVIPDQKVDEYGISEHSCFIARWNRSDQNVMFCHTSAAY